MNLPPRTGDELKQPLTPRMIFFVVCQEMKLGLVDAASPRRDRRFMNARAAYAWLCRKHTSASWPEISNADGRCHDRSRSHSVYFESYKRIGRVDPKILDRIEARLLREYRVVRC